ncbi:MAG: phosphatase PAP2 family protein [Ruminococcus sp.]|nr:phosphatase PAP2 family protein [Ruminococcus sp.]
MFSKIQRFDDKVLDRIVKINRPYINRLMILFTWAGNFGLVWWMICLPFLTSRNLRYIGVNYVYGLSIAHLTGQILIKNLVKRARPCHSLDDDDLIVERPRYYSFPSGHTTASFAFVAVTFFRCSLLMFVLVFILASLIAFSRIYLRVHYFTDVFCGMILGLICGSFSVFLINQIYLIS